MSTRRKSKNGHTAPEDEPRLPVPVNRPQRQEAEAPARRGTVERRIKAVEVKLILELDGAGRARVDTGMPLFDQLLETVALHSLFDLEIFARGDLEVSPQYTVEEIGRCFGKALIGAIGDRAGLARYGEATRPVERSRVRCHLDLGGRPALVFQAPSATGKVGTFDLELARVFFEAVAQESRAALHLVEEHGDNRQHGLEACFIAFAAALRQAVALDPRRPGVLAMRGELD